MKAIMVMFDSLNRHLLPPYGCDWTHAPNFQRLSERALTFDRSYVCSMPCMPARRDFHTGRPHFLHRGWGPLEPFDDSTPEILKKSGVHTHLVSDHYHYWEDGGATYHPRYNTWQFERGQEGDPWIGQVKDPQPPSNNNGGTGAFHRQDWVNREFMQDEGQHSQERTFSAGLDFIERNKSEDNWFLQIECFDPHEPFFSREQYKDLYPREEKDAVALFDWPSYKKVDEAPEVVAEARRNYAALLSMCDEHLGQVLDAMDAGEMWDDTMLIVWTDHGFMLGEHDWWGKVRMPLYGEIAHTPFFVWDPRSQKSGERRASLVQPSIDLGPTLLDYFGLEPTEDMLGAPLRGVIENDAAVREAGIFGYHGQGVNVTDGRYVYLREPSIGGAGVLYNYTLMPTTMRSRFGVEALRDMELAEPFSFTKGCRTLKIEVEAKAPDEPRSLLFDLQNDPRQEHPLDDAEIEGRMIGHMKRLMRECDAPPEQFARMGL